MIITADLHLKEESAATVLGEVLPGIFQACIARNEREVAILGDVLHSRYKVDVRLQNALQDEFKRWAEAGIQVRIIPGNHDQYEVSGRNALELFNEMRNVRVYTEPTWDADGLWIPYRKDAAAVSYAITNSACTQSGNTLFMHHGIRGAWMNDNVQDSEGLDLESLLPTKWLSILCGHYHKHQQIGERCWYIGSPWQTTANEAGQVKGFVSYSGKAVEFVPMSWGPRFHRFEVVAGQPIDLRGVNARDEVRIKTTGPGAEAAALVLGKQLAEAGLARHIVTPEVEPMQARLVVPQGATLLHYAKAYAEQMHGDLDMDQLMMAYAELTA